MGPARGVTLRSILVASLATVCVGVAVLTVPAPVPTPELIGEATPFQWDADLLFAALEEEFIRATAPGAPVAEDVVRLRELEGAVLLDRIARAADAPRDELLRLANLQFELAVQGAAHPALLADVQTFLTRSRVAVMRAAARWPIDRPTHEALYRVVFGGRLAIDEAIAQAGPGALPALVRIEDIPSAAPSIEVEGVRVHSGDVLLSRGGAPTSALIARGNDFPNTFSHTALAYVDPDTGEGLVVESLIEAGSVVTSVQEYLARKSHRILVMRLRPDHPALAADPLLAHHAAEAILHRVREEHIPYDFAMAWRDPAATFCSEIIYHPYHALGVDLWAVRSAISSPGLARWLGAMGVREFTTLVPSDIEYDPQLRAVAEWRAVPALMDFRLDNAITDALLEEAERGADLSYPWWALPPARAFKAVSRVRSMLGGDPTIPDGMSAASALRVKALVDEIHPPLKSALAERAEAFRTTRGYQAPYWTLVALARETLAEQRDALLPALTER